MDGVVDRTTARPAAGDEVSSRAPGPFATGPVAVVAALTAAGLTWANRRYGFFGDELYYRASGDRLSFGYADNGPLLPLLARLTQAVAPDSLVVLRLPAVVAAVAGVVVTAMIARELGGSRGAQLLAAVASAATPLLTVQGTLLTTNAVDTALWTVLLWLLVRWTRTRDDRLLLAAGVVTAVAMTVKWLIPLFWVVAVVAVLVLGPRELLRRPALWAGAGIVVLTAVPQLLWQAAHGWPQLALTAVVRAEQGGLSGQVLLVPLMLVSAGPTGTVLFGYGVWRLLRAPELRPYRYLGVTALGVVVAVAVLGGRPYYPAGVLPVCLAAAAVALADHVRRLPRRIVVAPLALVSVLLVVLGLRPTPAADVPPAAGGADLVVNGQFGWPELVAATTRAQRSLPPEVVQRTVIVADTYWSASALDQLGTGLPPVYGTGRGFWYFGVPPESVRTALVVSTGPPTGFRSVRLLATVDAPQAVPTAPQGTQIWFAEDPLTSWADHWRDRNELG